MRVKDFLNKRHVPFELVQHPAAAGGSHLAHVVHVHGGAVAKSVLLHANHGYTDLVAVVPADCHVDLESASRFLGGVELRLASEDDVIIRCPDCEHGVLPPFGSQYGMRTIVDRSLAANETIVFDCESHEEAIRMRFTDYQRAENPLIGSFADRR